MSFTLFSELPSELRLKIWREACHITRVLDLKPEFAGGGRRRYEPVWSHKIAFRTRSRNPPSILQVSHEARTVGLENYKLLFGTHFYKNLGGGPLFLSEGHRIYVNLRSDILYPVLEPRIKVHHRDELVNFLLTVLSRLPYCRVAIQAFEADRFEEKFGYELAWNGQHKEDFIVTEPLGGPESRKIRPGKSISISLRKPNPELWLGFQRQPDIGILHLAVMYLDDKIRANRERCPALASPFSPLVTPMFIEYDDH